MQECKESLAAYRKLVIQTHRHDKQAHTHVCSLPAKDLPCHQVIHVAKIVFDIQNRLAIE